MRYLGYLCVFMPDDTSAEQKKRLKEAGCAVIFKDSLSADSHTQSGLATLLSELRPKDCVVVENLAYLARSLQSLIAIIKTIHENGATIQSLDPAFDTGVSLDMFSICDHLCMAHQHMIEQRLSSARKAAKVRGLQGGRPEKINDRQKNDLQQLYYDNIPVQAICDRLNISRPTFYKYLKQ